MKMIIKKLILMGLLAGVTAPMCVEANVANWISPVRARKLCQLFVAGSVIPSFFGVMRLVNAGEALCKARDYKIACGQLQKDKFINTQDTTNPHMLSAAYSALAGFGYGALGYALASCGSLMHKLT